jgi:hypothetical protein
MSSKGRRKVRSEGSRPSTFFIVAIAAALLLLIVAFVSYVARTPGARPKEKKTAMVTFVPLA